jgi:hypothetical protein
LGGGQQAGLANMLAKRFEMFVFFLHTTMVRFRSASSQVPVDAADRNETWAELALDDLKADVSESTDVLAQNPATVQRLAEYAKACRSELGDKLT